MTVMETHLVPLWHRCCEEYGWAVVVEDGAGYQCVLARIGLQEFVLVGDCHRYGLLGLNKEGASSFAGYLAIVLASMSAGTYVLPRNKAFHGRSPLRTMTFWALFWSAACWPLRPWLGPGLRLVTPPRQSALLPIGQRLQLSPARRLLPRRASLLLRRGELLVPGAAGLARLLSERTARFPDCRFSPAPVKAWLMLMVLGKCVDGTGQRLAQHARHRPGPVDGRAGGVLSRGDGRGAGL